MSITIKRSVDIEDEVRIALKDHLTAYCRPLPKDFSLPCILITQVGGTDQDGQIDTFEVTLDARADNAADAIRFVEVNSSGSWGSDPARPDISMYSARLRVVAHLETKSI